MYSIESKMSNTQFIDSEEIFNPDYLQYIINNYDKFKDKKWDSEERRATIIDPLILSRKYLTRSRHGKIPVKYKQKGGKGRFCAVGSVSLQNMPKAIRHSIANQYYIDIDVKNAHPIFLLYLCKYKGFACSYLEHYITNRVKCLKEITFNGVYDREQAKNLYLCLTNGGCSSFYKVDKQTEHIIGYKKELENLHKLFASLNNEEFQKVKQKRIKDNKDYNHEAAYMNTLLCDIENTILMAMYEFFGKPKNVVYCFDGLMLPCCKDNDPKNYGTVTYDIEGCTKHIQNKFNMPLFELCIKDMDQGYNHFLFNEVPKYITPRLEYYGDFKKNLINDSGVYQEWVDEWIDNALKLIENKGKMFFITRNKEITTFSDKTQEIRDSWVSRRPYDIYESIGVTCKIINEEYDYKISKEYSQLDKKEQKKYLFDNHISKNDIVKIITPFNFHYLYSKKESDGKGYLNYIIQNRKIETYNSVDFYPLLQRKDNPPLEDVFNIFTEFPYESVDIEPSVDFEKSLLYKHLQKDFFNNDEGELNHFLDHIADLIQDPAQIKGTSHLFYSRQGCGKGLLFKFMTKLLGVANVVSITNTDSYFNKNFNSDVSNKLLKVFEEVSEKGSAFKNHNRLKGEQTSETERVEPKGVDAYYNRHCARFWYCTNNANSLYIESDDRRHTLHKISSAHQNDYDYFKPIWDEIKDPVFLKSSFEYFCDREYEEKNVMNAYTTQYKKEQKDANLASGIKFIINFVKRKFEHIEDKTIKVMSSTIKESYKSYCENRGQKYHISTLNTQIRKIGIEKPSRYNINVNGEKMVKYCYKINTYKLQEEMKRFLQDDKYSLDIGTEDIEEIDEGDVLGDVF